MPCLIMQYIVEQPPRKLLWEMKLLLYCTCIFYFITRVLHHNLCMHSLDQFDHYVLCIGITHLKHYVLSGLFHNVRVIESV